MCPDPQLLSTYIDGELPSPWKEKLEAHLEQCSECAEKLEVFRQQRLIFKEAGASSEETASMETARERVWHNIESRRRMSRYRLWSRRLSIPLPAAAAAAVVVALLAILLFRASPDRNNGLASQPVDPAVSRASFVLASEDEPGVIPMANLDSVLQYLGADGSEIIILQLPESKSFLRSGEPDLIRAADYTRRNP